MAAVSRKIEQASREYFNNDWTLDKKVALIEADEGGLSDSDEPQMPVRKEELYKTEKFDKIVLSVEDNGIGIPIDE